MIISYVASAELMEWLLVPCSRAEVLVEVGPADRAASALLALAGKREGHVVPWQERVHAGACFQDDCCSFMPNDVWDFLRQGRMAFNYVVVTVADPGADHLDLYLSGTGSVQV